MLSARAAIHVVLVSVALATFAVGFAGGPPAGFTGAPNSNATTEPDCSVCHSSFPVNSGPATFEVTGPGTLVGQGSVQVTVAFPATTQPRHGFQVTSRDGNLDAVGNAFSVVNSTTTQLNGANYANHTLAGTSVVSWSVDWSVPGSLVPGPVTFWASGNDANQDFGPLGDYIHTASHTLYQARISSPAATWPVGTTQNLQLTAPTVPNHLYVIAVSDDATGVTPLGGPFNVPLVVNSLSFLAWNLPSVFQGFVSVLDGSGSASAQVAVPAEPVLSGLVLHYAAATIDPAAMTISEITNRLTTTLQ